MLGVTYVCNYVCSTFTATKSLFIKKWVGILETTIKLIWIVCSMVISVTRVVKIDDSSYAQDAINMFHGTDSLWYMAMKFIVERQASCNFRDRKLKLKNHYVK